MKRILSVLPALLLYLLGTNALHALTVIARDPDQLVTRADTVFKGTVTTKASVWIGEANSRHIVTFVTFQVEETYKGAPATEQTLRFLGGTVGNQTMDVPDMPRFEVGQKAVLFVVGNGKQFCPLVGVAQGRFHVVKDETAGNERVFTDDGSPVFNTVEIGHVDAAGLPLLSRYVHTGTQAMTAESFKAAILDKVAAHTSNVPTRSH